MTRRKLLMANARKPQVEHMTGATMQSPVYSHVGVRGDCGCVMLVLWSILLRLGCRTDAVTGGKNDG